MSWTPTEEVGMWAALIISGYVVGAFVVNALILGMVWRGLREARVSLTSRLAVLMAGVIIVVSFYGSWVWPRECLTWFPIGCLFLLGVSRRILEDLPSAIDAAT